MNSFGEIIRMQFKESIQYKWSFALTLIIYPIMLLITIALFKSIYAYNHTNLIKGYSLDRMIWYYVAVNFIYNCIWNYTDIRISERILNGNLTVDLLRPVSLFKFEFARAIATRITAVICEFIPGLFLFSLIYYPGFLTVASFAKFSIMVIMAFILYYLFNFILGLAAFLTKNNTSIVAIRMAFVNITGGALIPLEFYPGWLNRILDFLPFKYIFYWPVQFFLNRESTRNLEVLLHIFGLQLVWALILYLLCKFLWGKVVKQFCAAGG